MSEDGPAAYRDSMARFRAALQLGTMSGILEAAVENGEFSEKGLARLVKAFNKVVTELGLDDLAVSPAEAPEAEGKVRALRKEA